MKTLQNLAKTKAIKNTAVYLSLGIGACTYYLASSYISDDYKPIHTQSLNDKDPAAKHVTAPPTLQLNANSSLTAPRAKHAQIALLQKMRARTQDVISTRKGRG